MMEDRDVGVCAAGVLGPLRLEDVLFTAQKSSRIAPLFVARADRIVGFDHIRSAALHALRAQREGRMQAKSIDVELARYLSGERQIRVAIERLGIEEGTQQGAVIGLGPKGRDAVRHIVDALGLREDDAVMDASRAKLVAFGVTAAAIGATTPGHELDLVLEAVALVDLMK